MASKSIMPPKVRGSRPRKMFSATESCGISISSWWMMTMPASSLSLMVVQRSSWPFHRMVPPQLPKGCTADSTFIMVDLPAPFSPHSPTHSPGRTRRSMPSSAFTPEKLLVMPRISSR